MEQRQLGNTGIRISSIGLGTMGMDHAYGPQADRTAMKELLNQAVEWGCNVFDTAPIYGEDNEKLVGAALKDRREEVVIATKFGITGQEFVDGKPQNVTNSTPESIRQQLEASLERLQTTYIDVYFQHRIDPDVEPEEVAETMKALIAEGKIKAWGVSEAPMDYVQRAHGVCPLAAVENQYSMVWRKPEEELFDFCAKHQVTLFAYSPLGNGFLSGRYSTETTFDERDVRNVMGRFQPEVMKQNQAVLDEVERMAEEKQATPAQIVLAWELAQQPFIVPIPGTTKLHRLQENLGGARVVLSDEDAEHLTRTLDQLHVDETYF